MSEVSKQINRDFTDLDHHIFFLRLGSENYQEVLSELMSFLNQRKGLPGIYVTVSKPYKSVKEEFEKKGIDLRKIIFIDAITSLAANEPKKKEYCFCVGSPQDLTGISIATIEAISSLGQIEKYVVLDSLSILSVHNSPVSVAKFAHFLISKMRLMNVCGIIIALETDASNDILNQIIPLSDKLVKMGGA